jgi:hypothetical protein
MGTKTIFFLTAATALLFSIGAVAAGEISGKTADGCTYKVINGQYLTSCPKRGAAPPTASDSVHTVSAAASAGPVTDYGAVPVRHNNAVGAPALPPQQPNQSAPISSIEKDASVATDEDFDAGRRERLKNKIIDQTYVGLAVGASNMKETNTGSATGFGLNLGTNIDDTFGVELGYGYARQDLNLGLASRGSSTTPDPAQQQPQQQGGGFGAAVRASDASLSTNLFTGEVLAHLTDPVKRLRPYLGAGLGWRSAALTESADNATGLAGGELHQNTFGGLASLGTKLRITKALNLGFAFHYFFPLARQDARLQQPVAALGGQTPTQSKLSASDDLLTGSSQYQILGGVQYSF